MIFKYKIRRNAAQAASPKIYRKIVSMQRTKSGMTTLTMDLPEEQESMMQLAVAIMNDERDKIPDFLSFPELLAFIRFCKEWEMTRILGPQGVAWASQLSLPSGNFQTVWMHMEIGNLEEFRTQFAHLFVRAFCVAGAVVDSTGLGPNDYGLSLPECLIDAIKFGRLDIVRRVATLVKKFIDSTNKDGTTCICGEENRAGCSNARIGHALRLAMSASIATAVFAPEKGALEQYTGSIRELLARAQATEEFANASDAADAPHVGATQPQHCMWLDDWVKETDGVLSNPDLGEDGAAMWTVVRQNQNAAATWSASWRADLP